MDIESIRKLIADLEAAPVGSRELDALIWAELDNRDVRQNQNNLILAKSRIAPHDECLLGTVDPGELSSNFQIAGHTPPISHYTTSLDAKLPGEDIYKMLHILYPRPGTYRCLDGRSPPAPALYTDKYCGVHKSEPIARRLAALKAKLAELETQ